MAWKPRVRARESGMRDGDATRSWLRGFLQGSWIASRSPPRRIDIRRKNSLSFPNNKNVFRRTKNYKRRARGETREGKQELVTPWLRVVCRLRTRLLGGIGAGAEAHPHRLSGDPVRPRRAHRIADADG